jgi:hypothetical protein
VRSFVPVYLYVHMRWLVGKRVERRIYYTYNLRMEFVKVGSYNFPAHMTTPDTVVFFMRPLLDTQVDMPGLDAPLFSKDHHCKTE